MQKPHVASFFDQATCTWTYVVHDDNGRAAIIDSVLDYNIYSGEIKTTSADVVADFIQEKKLSVEWLLETHIHADHLTAASYLKTKLGGKTAIGQSIVSVLKTWQPIFQNQVDTPVDGSQFDYIFNDDEVFFIGSLQAKVLPTPGHTPVDITYLIGDAAFVGDALFLPDVGTGRCDFKGGSARQSFLSCRKLFLLPDETRVFVGHDYPPAPRSFECMTTMGEQKRHNIRVHVGIKEEDFIAKRNEDDRDKEIPKLLLPSIQVNLRAGEFGLKNQSLHFIKIPVTMSPKK